MNKIKKLLIKMFMPSAEDIANMATDAVAKFINESGREEAIAKYGTIGDEFTKVQAKITQVLITILLYQDFVKMVQ